MSQCVPSWDNNPHNDTYSHTLHPHLPPAPAKQLVHSRNLDSGIVPSSAPEVPAMLDYEVAELTWENGQLALHGLGQPRTSGAWPDKHQPGSGTLESIVNQATCCFFNPNDKSSFDHRAPTASAALVMDALVPLCSNTNNNNCNCNHNNNNGNNPDEDSNARGTVGHTHVGSCSAGMKRTRQGVRQVPVVGQDWSARSEYSANSSRQQQVTVDTCTERDQGTTAFTSTSVWSAENTSSGMPCTRLTGDDHDSICLSRSIMKNERGSGENKKQKASNSAKRSRAADIHNQSERKRRDKINQRMKTLQKLVPNSNKTDKASMLDEVIDYLKQLQAQVNMMNRMNTPQMAMMPMALNQQAALQMTMMAQMGMGGMLDMNAAAAAALAAGRANMQPILHPSAAAAAFMPMPPASWDAAAQAMMSDPMSAFLACQQSQPMTMDAYRMMASLYQHMQQAQQAPNSKS